MRWREVKVAFEMYSERFDPASPPRERQQKIDSTKASAKKKPKERQHKKGSRKKIIFLVARH